MRSQAGLDHRGEPVGVQPGEVGAGAVGAVAIDRGSGGLLAGVLARDQVGKQRRADRGVSGGRRAHLGGTDDLSVGVGRHMHLVAVKAVGGGLVAVAGLGVDGRDHPVRAVPSKL